MKKPYRLRWEPKFFVRAIIFGILFLAFQLVLNYLKRYIHRTFGKCEHLRGHYAVILSERSESKDLVGKAGC